jgi:hypothetical protein
MSSWKQGFAEVRTLSAFTQLLQEMVGLGVLREAGQASYALRSLNVVPLLGTREQIEQQLGEAQQVEPEKSINPMLFRSPLVVGDKHSRAPLTAHQLDLVRGHKRSGLVVLRGAAIADAPQVRRYLEEAFKGTLHVAHLVSSTTLELFQRNLAERLRSRDRETGLVVIIDSTSWTLEWIQEAWTRLNGLTSRPGWVRIVFVLHPRQAWRYSTLVQMGKERMEGIGKDVDFQSLPLTPWSSDVVKDHLQEDRAIVACNTTHVDDVLDVTSGWPGLIAQLGGHGSGADFTVEGLALSARIDEDIAVAKRVIEDFGIPDELRQPLRLIAASPPLQREYWPLLLQDPPLSRPADIAEQEARRILDWLEEFDYARPGDRGTMVLDPRLASALCSRAKAHD